MADFRKETHGPGAMKGVNLVVLAYDNRVAKNPETSEVSTHYLDARIHPEDRRAAGQSSLALVSKKDDKSPTGYNNSARYSAGQFAAIQKAAGDNVTDLTDQKGNVVGKIYGVKADVLVSKDGVIANTKTLEASEHSVHDDAQGQDIRSKIFATMKASKAAREAAKETQTETPAVEATSKPATTKAAATKTAAKKATKPRTAAPVLVGAGGPEVSADEPELG